MLVSSTVLIFKPWPIVEKPVDQTTVPDEKTAKTQPFPTKPPAFDRQGVTKDQMVDWLIHVNSYIGTPRAVAALRVAREVWTEMGEEKRRKK